MSWLAVGMVGGALIGGVSQNSTNKANAKLAKNAGKVDITTTRTGDPRADPYREAGMQAAYNALFPGRPQPVPALPGAAMPPPDRPVGGGLGGIDDGHKDPDGNNLRPSVAPSKVPAGSRVNKAGKVVPIRNPATPGGGTTGAPAAPAERKFDGMSQETADIRADMRALPETNRAMNTASESFLTDTLEGTERNAYRGEAAEAARAISADPGLQEYIDTLKEGSRRGTGGGDRVVSPSFVAAQYGGGGGAAGGPASFASSTGADKALRAIIAGEELPGEAGRDTGSREAIARYIAGEKPTGAWGENTGTREALSKLVAGEAPAGWADAEAAISRRVNESRASNIRELRARAVGSGFYGGDLYKDLETGAIAKGDQEMTDSLAAARFSAYQNALNLGASYDQAQQAAHVAALGLGSEHDLASRKTYQDAVGQGAQYDLGMADLGSRERASAASAASAARSAGASRASAERQANLAMWGDALGLGQQGRTASAAALGDLAGMTSEDQRFAVSGVNDLAGSRRADLGVAGDLSLGADSNRNAFRASENQLAGVRAGVNLGRAELDFDKERFYDPLSRTGAYADVLNGLFGGYGSERTVGQDQRAAGGGGYSSPWGAAMTGAALGGQIGSQYGKSKAPTTGGP